MATIAKTAGIAVLAQQAITHPDTVKGSAQDVSTKLAATILMFHAGIEEAANTNPGSFHVQVSGSAAGDEDWVTVAQFTAAVQTFVTDPLTATEPVGETVIAVAATVGFVAGGLCYVQDDDVLAQSEWHRIQEIVTNTSVNLIDGLVHEKTNSHWIWNLAEVFVCSLDLTAISRLRVIFQHEGAAGANVHVKALMVTGDSIA